MQHGVFVRHGYVQGARGERTLRTLAGASFLALVMGVSMSIPALAASSTISGVVTDSVTSAPIAGVQVSTNPASVTATTNVSGAYSLTVTAGTYDVLFTLSGYNSNFVGAVNAPGGGTATANVALVKVPANAAQDLFSRPDQTGIGTASDGHTWSNDLNVYPAGKVSIVGQKVFIQTVAGNTDHDTWMGISYRDEEITADINAVATLPGGIGVQHGGRLLARVLGSDQWVVLTLNPTDNSLTIWVDNSGNWTQLASATHAFSLNVWYHAKLDVIGTVVYGKAWAFGTSEPAWQITTPQSVINSAGVGGLRTGGADAYFANYLEIPITQIAGKVTNAANGSAVAGVTVSLTKGTTTTTTTDVSGKYVFSGLAAGTYTVSSAPSGYNPVSGNVTVSTGVSGFANLALTASPAPGLLRVTTSPAIASQITVDGNIADTWGLNWLKIAPGSHAVCFSWVQGFTTPACQTVSVSSSATTTVNGSFVQRGFLHVFTSPTVPSTISIDGVPSDDWGVFTDIPVGSHQVCFGLVANFTPPACQTAVVTAGSTTNITGTFTSSPGASGQTNVGLLRVVTSPAVASQITVDGNIADTWGLNWLEIAPGSHTVCFMPIQGFTGPACQTVAVTAGATTAVTGTFVQRGFIHVVTSPVTPATIFIDGVASDDWGVFTDLPVGTHQVCFGQSVNFASTPACQSAVITAGANTVVTGTYS
jgi:carboxypeptidase family protein